MDKDVICLLRKNNIIVKEGNYFTTGLANVHPFKNNVIKVFSSDENKSYVIKRCKQEEIKNLKKADDLLYKNGITDFRVLTPIDNTKNLLLFEDIGIPLNRIFSKNKKISFEEIIRINNFFLQSGYWWGGIALRNMFYLNETYYLVDFEKFFKIEDSDINRRHLLFLRINLIQSFDKKIVEKYIKFLENEYHFSNKTREMDGVEKIGREAMNFKDKNKFLQYFDRLTVFSETPLSGRDLRPFEIGHFVDELVSAKISFLWTMLMYKKRKSSEDNFRRLLSVGNKIMNLKEERLVKFHLAVMIGILGDTKKYKKTIGKIEKAKHNHDARRYDEIVIDIVKAVCKFINIDFKKISIIARGSYGECILTKESDIDFEIVVFENNKIRPMVVVENLVCEVLNYLGIIAEGTSGRPTEKDVVINGESRDLFEVFELRLISGDKTLFLEYLKRYKELIYRNSLWKNKTKYEKKNKPQNFKNLFGDVRFLVTRLALMHTKKIISPVVHEKIKMCPEDLREKLGDIIKDLICIRNGEVEGLGKYQLLVNGLNEIKIKYKISN